MTGDLVFAQFMRTASFCLTNNLHAFFSASQRAVVTLKKPKNYLMACNSLGEHTLLVLILPLVCLPTFSDVNNF